MFTYCVLSGCLLAISGAFVNCQFKELFSTEPPPIGLYDILITTEILAARIVHGITVTIENVHKGTPFKDKSLFINIYTKSLLPRLKEILISWAVGYFQLIYENSKFARKFCLDPQTFLL